MTIRKGGSVPVFDTEEKVCFLCGAVNRDKNLGDDEVATSLDKCPHCNLVWFCSEDHFEIHRPKNRCFPFIVRRSPEKGRFMVATRDIDPLELLLSEEPAVTGPYSKDVIGCMSCFRRLRKPYGRNRARDNHPTCKRCRLPVCDEICQNNPAHRDAECAFFSAHDSALAQKGKPVPAGEPRSIGTQVSITPLRMLLKKKRDRKAFSRIDMLQDHMNEATQVTCANNGLHSIISRNLNMSVLKVILTISECATEETYSQEEVQRMIGILKTNGMKLETHGGEQGVPGVALYPIYCLINHACYNNTNYVKFPDLHLELRSQVPIKKGEEIFTRYISSTIGNVRRREDIERHWYFQCTCARCMDPTEFGTFMSAMRCFDCPTGFLLPKSAASFYEDWHCSKCQAVVPHKTIDEVVSTLEDQVRVCPFVESVTPNAVGSLEEMLFHFQKLLHPNHYILIDIMHNLIHLYATKSTLSRPEKERKIQLCQNVLDVLGRVDPGFTKWRGTLLQELIHPLMMISKEDHNSGRISEREFHRRLQFCSRKLKEAKLCLRAGFTPIEEYLKEKGLDSEDPDARILAETKMMP